MITWAEIYPILRRVLRWWWMIVLAIAVAAGSAFYLSQQETRYYVAHTSLMIGNTLQSSIPDQNQLVIGSSLARYYGELTRHEPILKPVQESLHLPFAWEIISDRMLMTNVVPSANLLEIYVSDSNPERAAAIANAIGEQLIRYSPNAPDKIQAEQQAVEQQLQESQKKSKDIQDKISELSAQQQAATSASDLADINQKLALLQTNLDQEQASYRSLLNYKTSSVVNSLGFFERATPPNEPLPSKRKVIVGMAGLAGLMLALAAIYVIELLDTRWRGGHDVEERFKIDNLGYVPHGPPLLIAAPAFVEERYRAAREAQTNILLAAPQQGVRTLMLTSPHPSPSRTAFSIDLADLFARSGHKVLLVDAEFTSSLLTQMLASQAPAYAWAADQGDGHSDIWAHLRPTALPNVALLAGRSEADGAPALIPSLRWREIVQLLHGVADMIIFDGPASLVGPDAALLAPHVEGVVLALDPAKDDRDAVSKSKSRLSQHEGSNLLGAVVFSPSTHQFDAQKALKAPEGADAAATSIALAPQQPALVVRVMGREIRFVWSQPARRRKRNLTAEAPTGGRSGSTPVYPPAPPPQTTIVTPAPAADEVASEPEQPLFNDWGRVAEPELQPQTTIVTPAPAADEVAPEPEQPRSNDWVRISHPGLPPRPTIAAQEPVVDGVVLDPEQPRLDDRDRAVQPAPQPAKARRSRKAARQPASDRPGDAPEISADASAAEPA